MRTKNGVPKVRFLVLKNKLSLINSFILMHQQLDALDSSCCETDWIMDYASYCRKLCVDAIVKGMIALS